MHFDSKLSCVNFLLGALFRDLLQSTFENNMRRLSLLLFFAAFLTFAAISSSPTSAQIAFNNDAVIKMVKAGITEDLILATISSQAGAYDTSADGLIALKAAGVSDKILAAIIQKSSGTPAPSATNSSATPSAAASAADHTQQAEPQPAALTPKTERPRVFLSSASKGSNRNADRDQSMEMSKDLEKDCPGVRVTINSQVADYTILLNHIEHGLLIRDNQIQIANRDGDLISRTKEGGSIKGDVKKACAIILDDWSKK